LRYTVYRYLNLVHFFVHQAVSLEYRSVHLTHLVQCELLTPDEANILESHSNRSNLSNLIMLWLGALVRQASETNDMPHAVLRQLLEILSQLRGSSDTLKKEMKRVAPISFVQLMQVMIDMLLLLTPMALAYKFETTRESVMVYIWPAFGSMLVALFYQGGMRLITALEDPFSSDIDDLHPDWLLMSSEQALYLYLASTCPSFVNMQYCSTGAAPKSGFGPHIQTITQNSHELKQSQRNQDMQFASVLPPGCCQDEANS